MAMIRSSYERDLNGAEQEARAAIAHSPNYPRARQALAEVLTVRGRFDEAIREARRGVELDPLALYINAALAMAQHYARQFDAAIAQAQWTVDMEPFYPAYLILGLAYQETGRLSEAVAALERATNLSHRNTLMVAALGGALAKAGRTTEAAAILTELDEAARGGRYVSGVWVAAIYAALGDTDQALASLESGHRDRCCWLLRCVRLDPRLDVLRSVPRFNALLQTIG
jgi:tetratricopeptide (TPR) repeat protein